MNSAQLPAPRANQNISLLQALPGSAALAYSVLASAAQSRKLQLLITHDSFSAQQLEQDLLADAKEIAEHLMLIDLGRNDAGRVSETGPVKVTAGTPA